MDCFLLKKFFWLQLCIIVFQIINNVYAQDTKEVEGTNDDTNGIK